MDQIRCAPSVDLILLSHGDLAHVGLYPFAYARWNLKAPAYSTLPVQAMGRMAVTEDVEGIRDEEDVGDDPDNNSQQDEADQSEHSAEAQAAESISTRRKYVATLAEVHDAFEHLNTLRYSQPTHLQGLFNRRQFGLISLIYFSYFREMSRPHDHSFQCWAYPWWYHMENSFTFVRHYYLRR